MKRGLGFNSHQFNASPRDSNANCKFSSLLKDYLDLQKVGASPPPLNANCKFSSLLKDYLDLQKENVRKRRKIGSAKRKLETLVLEVRFLRQRYEYLKKNSGFSEIREDGCQRGIRGLFL